MQHNRQTAQRPRKRRKLAAGDDEEELDEEDPDEVGFVC